MKLTRYAITLGERLDTAYFAENWKFIAENTVVKYFLLLQITVHPFLALGWSMNSAMNQPIKTQGNATSGNKRTLSTRLAYF